MSKEIANWKQDLEIAAAKVAKTERPDDSYISLKGGVMSYQDNAIPDNKLEVVVVAASFARSCFMRPYDGDDTDPPECFANAIDIGDLAPHENVVEPFAKVCSEKACEWAVFGTALQGKGPRCKTRRKLMVMPVSGLENPAEAEIATLAIPPTSIKNWSAYANKIASGAGLPPWGVKTMITVKPHPKKQFEVTFETTGPVDNDRHLAGIHSRIDEAEASLLQPYTYDAEEAPAPESKGSKKY
tara:strand:+ start:1591 stop:2316 length:726 start_codon:yes stop_codon:yes gene_type:complete